MGKNVFTGFRKTETTMNYAIGIDISDQTFTVSCVTPTFQRIFVSRTFAQSQEGWDQLLTLCDDYRLPKDRLFVIMEATGVYSERISHYLHQHGLAVFVEPPGKIHHAFYERGKTDPVDSRQIAEYGFRFDDQLHHWQPKTEILDQIQTLLATREQFTSMMTACKNARHGLSRKHYRIESALLLYGELSKDIETRIDRIDREIHHILATNCFLCHIAQNIQSIPNIGFLLTVNLLVVTDGFTRHLNHTQLASYMGICPFEYQSGTSIHRRPRSDGAGPARLRKLIYLTAMRLRRNHPAFRAYFERKVAEGKPKRLILNNISNHALKLICGVIRSGKPYIKNYRSLPPHL